MCIEDLRNEKYYFPKYKEEISDIQYNVTNEIYKRLDDIKVIEVYQDNGTYIDSYIPFFTSEKRNNAIKKELDNIIRIIYKNGMLR